jgi:putative transposase
MRTIRPEVLDELFTGYEKPSDLLGESGLFRGLKKALLERALNAELSAHLGYEKARSPPAGPATTGTATVPKRC